jgi:hypothetical protein
MQNRRQGREPVDRRVFVRSGIILAGATLAGAGLLHAAEENEEREKEVEVGPPEDLMREHGVLKRVLLIYGEVLRRLDVKQDLSPEALGDALESFAVSSRIITRNSRRTFCSRVLKRRTCSSIW